MGNGNWFYTEGDIVGWPNEKELMDWFTADDYYMYSVTMMLDETLRSKSNINT